MTSMLGGIVEWFGDFFGSLFNLIPKIIYLLYASLACLLDVFQLFFRKLAGLDVFYVDGEAVTGDLVTNFITGILGWNKMGFTYSALSTVFWSMILFGIILCFACTLLSIIKSHYTYDDKSAKGPMQFVYTAGKAIINIAAVPVIVVLGLYVSEALLTALDTMTSTNSGTIASLYGDKVSLLESTESSRMQGKGAPTFIYYDMFGYGSAIFYGVEANPESDDVATTHQLALIASTVQPFSGSLFKTAAYNANRARLGQILPDSEWSGCGDNELFANANSGEGGGEILADMIDTAFACNLHLHAPMKLNYGEHAGGEYTSVKHFTNFLTNSASAFSKFNVGLVWYYYDLWQFNFIVGFAGCIICVTLFINIIFGMMTRLFMCIGLFLIYPPLFGLAPFDGGKASKSWRENFSKQVLMAYGAVIGMNIMFLILPYMNTIDFFNIKIIDMMVQSLIIIVGLITIKAFIEVVSGLIGGADANAVGEKAAKEAGAVAGKATKMTIGAARNLAALPGNAIKAGKAIKAKAGEIKESGVKIKNPFTGKTHTVGGKGSKAQKNIDTMKSTAAKDRAMDRIARMDYDNIDKESVLDVALQEGMSKKEAKKMFKAVDAARQAEGRTSWNNNRGRGRISSRVDAISSNLSGKGGDRAYRKGVEKFDRGAARTANLSAQQTIKDRSDRRLNMHRETFGENASGLAGVGSLAFTPFTNFDSIMKGSDGYKEFKENSFWSKPDWAKETAKNTAKIASNQETMQGQLSGIGGNVQSAESNIKKSLNQAKAAENARYRQLETQFIADVGRPPNAAEKRDLREMAKAGRTDLP